MIISFYVLLYLYCLCICDCRFWLGLVLHVYQIVNSVELHSLT